jgi:heme/copper-type cytochrome/quinol oxidase subunit 4
MNLPKGKMFTLCNLAILLIAVLVLVHILGYVDIRIKNREGMSNSKTTATVIMWLSIVIGILYILSTSFTSDTR